MNRALLARQILLERASLPIPRALEEMGGLQNQYAPSGYIGLWSRLEGFPKDSLTHALEERRVVQGTLMRVTIHLVSVADYRLFAKGVRKGRREWWLRVHGGQVQPDVMKSAARRLRGYLADGPRRQTELVELLHADGFPRIVWSGAGLWLDMVRVPPTGTWDRRRADLYGLADDWLRSPRRPTEAEGLEHLVRRYLGGFGPASVNDLGNWCGLSVTRLRRVVRRLKLRHFRDERGGELLDLPRAPLPDPETPAPVRFLPTWDATLLAHARRTQILPERYRTLVFNSKTPHSISTFLVDGAVAGSWRYEKGRVRPEPFESLPRSALRQLRDEADRLAAFHEA